MDVLSIQVVAGDKWWSKKQAFIGVVSNHDLDVLVEFAFE